MTQIFLPSDEVHIWFAQLDLVPRSDLEALLSPDEKERAARFYFERDRQRFAVARGILRSLLGKYLAADPSQIEFAYSDRGKPALAGKDSQKLHFNVSHSQELGLYAIARHPVGVDIECWRELSDAQQLAKRFFAPAEAKAIADAPPQHQQAIFFRYWTCKEAFLKATGTGISQSLSQIEISLAIDKPAKLVNSDLQAKWHLQELQPAPDCAAAVVASGSNFRLQLGKWEDREVKKL